MSAHAAIQRLAAAPDDRQAWTAAVEACQGLCWRIALRMLGPDAAPDAVQDALLALRAAARRFRPGADTEASAVAWIARIAVNTCHHHRRRAGRAGQPLAAGSEPPAPAPAGPDAETLAHLAAALDELPADQREAIGLRYFAGLDFAAVAESAGIRSGAARMRVQRGLDALRGLLERRGVAIPAVVLAGLLDGIAAAEVPAPPAAAAAAWSGATLPPLTATISLGAIAMISALCAAGIVAAVAVTAPEPPRPPTPVPVSAAAVPSVEDSLGWLAQRQGADGAWGTGERAGELTARAALAFLGAGYNHQTPNRHQKTMKAAAAWLASNPYLGDDVRTAALQAMVLAECLAMTGDQKLSQPATNALSQLIDLQPAWARGWPARRGSIDIDPSSTALAVLAVKSAIAAGIDSDPSVDPQPGEITAVPARGDKPGQRMIILKPVASGPWPPLPHLLDEARLLVARCYHGGLPEPHVPAPIAVRTAVQPATGDGDAAALAILAFTCRKNEPAWTATLLRRALAAAPAGDAEQAWFVALGSFQFGRPERYPWLEQAARQAQEKGDIAALATLTTARQVFIRFQRLPDLGAPAPAPRAGGTEF